MNLDFRSAQAVQGARDYARSCQAVDETAGEPVVVEPVAESQQRRAA